MESLIVLVASSNEPNGKTPLSGPTTGAARLRSSHDAAFASCWWTASLLDVAQLSRMWSGERVAVDANRRVVWSCAERRNAVVLEAAARCGAHLEEAVDPARGAQVQRLVDAEFARGARAVCVIDTRTPTLPVHLVEQAFRALAWHKVALGPTPAGRLWCIAMQRSGAGVIDDDEEEDGVDAVDTPASLAPHVGPAVVQRAMARVEQRVRAPATMLPLWPAVDDDADLVQLAWHLRGQRVNTPQHAAQTWQVLVDAGLAQVLPTAPTRPAVVDPSAAPNTGPHAEPNAEPNVEPS